MPSNTTGNDDRVILIGMTGGVAAYKMASLVSDLVQADHQVVVAMTEAATRFVGPLTFQSLTGREVVVCPWTATEGLESPHIHLARIASVMLVAPCSMDMLGQLATGRCNNAVSLLAASIDRSRTPVLLAPSMNETMLDQPATRRNITQLAEDGFDIIEPAPGWQACRTEGRGRLPEPAELRVAIEDALANAVTE
ncbi:MAG TPA: hypothetical protein DEO57_08900 [Phycisphaerales bacterium]|nr:hypothetical protein [Phycisphaerales bacterium]